MSSTITPETFVPADETPAAQCPYCERPFRSQRAHDLHVGEEHPDRHTDAEAEAYEQAASDEDDELFGFHMKVFVAIGVLHTVIVLAYMIVFGGGFA